MKEAVESVTLIRVILLSATIVFVKATLKESDEVLIFLLTGRRLGDQSRQIIYFSFFLFLRTFSRLSVGEQVHVLAVKGRFG